ncbi:hypothetical protein [Marinobacter changyiensis]|uniref:hypothetical protein n=1 Tax=Marinobacter changyiensis TaxID=2604091 RepID=UPI0012644B44|nr:hypothetical protein [Marinobacter changyiensis]
MSTPTLTTAPEVRWQRLMPLSLPRKSSTRVLVRAAENGSAERLLAGRCTITIAHRPSIEARRQHTLSPVIGDCAETSPQFFSSRHSLGRSH